MEQPEIETERLILRRFTSSDAGIVKELAGNYNVAKTTLNVPHPYDEGMAELWIESHPEKWSSKTGAVFAITTKELNQLVGTVSLMDIEGTQAEIGYWIGEPFWGNGYCTEAVNALIQFSLDNLGSARP
ncbi:GNAT family N-acetyltransferase [Pseudomonadota bacterium]